MPRTQVVKLQKLRYALRQAFSAYCSSPQRAPRESSRALDSTVALLQGSVDESGRPLNGEDGYRPKVAAYVSSAGAAASEDYAILAAAGGIAASKGKPSYQAVPAAPKAKACLKDGLEIQGLTDLLRELYG